MVRLLNMLIAFALVNINRELCQRVRDNPHGGVHHGEVQRLVLVDLSACVRGGRNGPEQPV